MRKYANSETFWVLRKVIKIRLLLNCCHSKFINLSGVPFSRRKFFFIRFNFGKPPRSNLFYSGGKIHKLVFLCSGDKAIHIYLVTVHVFILPISNMGSSSGSQVMEAYIPVIFF